MKFRSKYRDVSHDPCWSASSIAGYQIEVDLSDRHRPLQRHIWTKRDGAVDAEEWIGSIPDTAERLLSRGWEPCP